MDVTRFVQLIVTDDGSYSLYETITYLPERLFSGDIRTLRTKVEECFFNKLRSVARLVPNQT
jgi:hypothetical protein